MPIFAHPWWLIGLVAVAIPLMVHLFMRRPLKAQLFPPMQFVGESHSATSAVRRLKRLLLLFLRMAAVALAVLTLARPMVKSRLFAGVKEQAAAAVLCFDTSASMGYASEDGTRLDAAKALARQVVLDLPAGSCAAVVSSEAGEELSLSHDLDNVLEDVRGLEVGWSDAPLGPMLRRAFSVLEKAQQQRREIYIFTDMTRWPWRTCGAEEFSDFSGIAVYIIDVGAEAPQDVGLGTVRLDREALPRNAPAEVTAEVRFVGPSARPTAAVQFWVDGKLCSQRLASRPEGAQSASVKFYHSFESEGFHEGRLVLAEESNLPADDRRYFTFCVGPLPEVLIVNAEGASILDVVACALAPPGLKAVGKHSVEVKVLEPADVDGGVLRSSQAVMVIGSAKPLGGLWQKLKDYAAAGGGLVFIPAAGGEDAYNSAEARAVVPVRVLGIGHPKKPAMLDVEGYRDPILAEFGGGEHGDLTVPRFTRYLRVEPFADSVVRLSLSGAEPAIVEGRIGKGRVLFLAFSPHEEWGNLAGQQEMPVLMHSLVRYLTDRGERTYNFASGETVSSQVLGTEGMEVVFPDGSRRPAQLVDGENPRVQIPNPEPGNYRVVVAGRPEEVRAAISVNIPEEETDISAAGRIREAELAEFFAPDVLGVARGQDGIEQAEIEVRVGRDLTPLLVLLLVAALLAEGFLANRFYRFRASARA